MRRGPGRHLKGGRQKNRQRVRARGVVLLIPRKTLLALSNLAGAFQRERALAALTGEFSCADGARRPFFQSR